MTEKYTVSGKDVLEKVKQLIHEGNIRRVRLIHEGKTIIEIPLSIGAPAVVVGIIGGAAFGGGGGFCRPRDRVHYRGRKSGGKKVIFSDIPTQIGIQGRRGWN